MSDAATPTASPTAAKNPITTARHTKFLLDHELSFPRDFDVRDGFAEVLERHHRSVVFEQ